MKGKIHEHENVNTNGFKQNPQNAGRGKGVLNSSTRLKKLLELVKESTNPITGEKEDFTVAELTDAKLINIVLGKNTKDLVVIAAYKELLDRLEGKAKQAFTGGVDEQGNDKNIIIEVVNSK